MKTKNAFTLVELIVTFALVSTISFLLFQLIISLKNIYTSSDLKTMLLIEQGNLTRRVNTDFFKMPLEKVQLCGNADAANTKLCLIFTLDDKVLEKSVTKMLQIYPDKIVYDGYQMSLSNGSKLGDVSKVVSYIDDTTAVYDSILTIDVPVTNKLIDGNYGLHMTVQYSSITTRVPEELLDNYTEIEIVTTTPNDIAKKTVTSGDGLYNTSLEEWYDSKNTEHPKYVYRGEMPNNYVIFNKRCYRMISITNDMAIKMIYESDADEGRCNMVNTSGSIDTSEWSSDSNSNNWIASSSVIRNIILPGWLNDQSANKNRLSSSSNFSYGAVSSDSEDIQTLIDQQIKNKGESSLPDKSSYLDHDMMIGLPMVSDYIMASLDPSCNSIADATTTNYCKNKNFLYKNYDYWTINPDSENRTNVWTIGATGSVETASVSETGYHVRPVIYLKSSTKFSGGGTTSNPYVVK